MNSTNPNPHIALADAAEQRANAATPGPWFIKQMTHRDDWPRLMSAQDPDDLCHVSDLDDGIEVKDQDFITHARQDVPALAAAVREQAATIERCANHIAAIARAHKIHEEYKLEPEATTSEVLDCIELRMRTQAATIAALQTSLTASERRECAYRAHLEELGYTGAVEEGVYHALQTKLTEALALAYEGYKEGGLKGAAYARGERWDDMDEAWDKSETRAAAERLEDAK